MGVTAVLFNRNMEPRCAYCRRCTVLDGERVLCIRKGIVSAGNSCRRFRYDPLKRVPPKPVHADFSRLREEDFSI